MFFKDQSTLNIVLSLLEECLMNLEILSEPSKNVSSSLGLHNVHLESSLKQVVVKTFIIFHKNIP